MKPPVLVAEPFVVVTVTSTRPSAWAGRMQVTVLASTTVTEVAAVPPKVTAEVPVKFTPVIVMGVPPPMEPLTGLTVVNAGQSSLSVRVWTVVAPDVAFVGVPIVTTSVSSGVS